MVVRVDPRCATEARTFHWRANGEPAGVVQVVREEEATFMLLRVGRLGADRLTLTLPLFPQLTTTEQEFVCERLSRLIDDA